ncbi:MAG: hypothetical protein FJ184_08650 [Gammaproteobacteria bacterium]|nr:hypothetical protein [Gammaproteobacteria bacterium]
MVIIDWCSVVPLSDVIKLDKRFIENVTFVYLDSAYLKTNGFCPDQLNVPHGSNVGLCKSSATYVFWGAADLIATSLDFLNLSRALDFSIDDESTLLLIERCFLSRSYFEDTREFSEVDNRLEMFFVDTQIIAGEGGGAAFIGGQRIKLLELGGNNEACALGGNDNDLFCRAQLKGSCANLSRKFGVRFYKLPRSSGGTRAARAKVRDDEGRLRPWFQSLKLEALKQGARHVDQLKPVKGWGSQVDMVFPSLNKRKYRWAEEIRYFFNSFLLIEHPLSVKQIILETRYIFNLDDLKNYGSPRNFDEIYIDAEPTYSLFFSIARINSDARINFNCGETEGRFRAIFRIMSVARSVYISLNGVRFSGDTIAMGPAEFSKRQSGGHAGLGVRWPTIEKRKKSVFFISKEDLMLSGGGGTDPIMLGKVRGKKVHLRIVFISLLLTQEVCKRAFNFGRMILQR